MSDSTSGQVAGATTTAAVGAAVLPNTSNGIFTLIAWVAIAAAVAVIASMLITRRLKRN